MGFVQQVYSTQSMYLSIPSAVCHITKSKDHIYGKWEHKMHSDDLIKNMLFMPWSSVCVVIYIGTGLIGP